MLGTAVLCPICGQGGHWYYECPQRDLKEGTHKTPGHIQFLQGPLCQICHLNHEPPCTIGLKQHKQVQEAFSQRRDGECGELVRIKPQGPTPFCMYCGQMKGRHGPECPYIKVMDQHFQNPVPFVGTMGIRQITVKHDIENTKHKCSPGICAVIVDHRTRCL